MNFSSSNEYSYEEDCDQWETEQYMDHYEDGYNGTWPQDDSSSYYGDELDEDEPEPEPPDPSWDTASYQEWYRKEANQESEDGDSRTGEDTSQNDHEDDQHGNDSWIEEFDYEISVEEAYDRAEGNDSKVCHEEERNCGEEKEFDESESWHEEAMEESWANKTESEISLGETDMFDEETWNKEVEPEDSFDIKSEIDEEEPKPRYVTFSGHSQGPDAYLRWERDMEEWFSSNQIPEEEKTIYAEETLTEDAFRHWDRDAYFRLEYDEPHATWEEMKQLMSDEFVRDVDNMR